MNKCICGDALKYMPTICSDSIDMIIADPPFNINWKYESYDDNQPKHKFIKWNSAWLTEAKRIIKNDGNILVCMGDEHISDIDIEAKRIGLNRIEWMIWHYSFGQSGKLENRKKFTRSKTHILRLAKTTSPYFNASAVAIPSDRQLKYNDNRADPRGKCPNDVFIYKRIAGTHKARVQGITTQMPVELLKTWVKAMCKENGTLLDPFAGSGSSLIAAKLEGRQYLGIEISETYTNIINNRLHHCS